MIKKQSSQTVVGSEFNFLKQVQKNMYIPLTFEMSSIHFSKASAELKNLVPLFSPLFRNIISCHCTLQLVIQNALGNPILTPISMLSLQRRARISSSSPS